VLGVVGAGGIGQQLKNAIDLLNFPVLDVAADDFGPKEQAAVYVSAPAVLTTDRAGR